MNYLANKRKDAAKPLFENVFWPQFGRIMWPEAELVPVEEAGSGVPILDGLASIDYFLVHEFVLCSDMVQALSVRMNRCQDHAFNNVTIRLANNRQQHPGARTEFDRCVSFHTNGGHKFNVAPHLHLQFYVRRGDDMVVGYTLAYWARICSILAEGHAGLDWDIVTVPGADDEAKFARIGHSSLGAKNFESWVYGEEVQEVCLM